MERRSARQRKTVNYTRFAASSDEDSEDDFASPPPAKKPKERKEVTQPWQESKLTHTTAGSVEPSTAAAAGGRPSRDEKQFNRDLQRVLEASQQTGNMRQPQPEAHSDPIEKIDDDDFRPGGGDLSSGCSSGTDSDFDASPPLPQLRKGRGKAAMGKVAATKSEPRSSKKRTESKAESVVKSASKSAGQAKKTEIAPTPAAKLPATLASTPPAPVKPEASGSPALPGNRPTPGLGVRRMPKWTPPAAAPAHPGSETTRRAPTGSGGGGIRVGLSRTARVKPLHTRPTIPNT